MERFRYNAADVLFCCSVAANQLTLGCRQTTTAAAIFEVHVRKLEGLTVSQPRLAKMGCCLAIYCHLSLMTSSLSSVHFVAVVLP